MAPSPSAFRLVWQEADAAVGSARGEAAAATPWWRRVCGASATSVDGAPRRRGVRAGADPMRGVGPEGPSAGTIHV